MQRLIKSQIPAFIAVLLLSASNFAQVIDGAEAELSTPLSAKELLQDFMSNAFTLSTDFTQVVIDEEGKLDPRASSAGVFALARPGKFRWQITEPNTQLIMSDGKNLWNYDVELEQATVKPVDESLSATPAMLLSGEENVLDAFDLNGSFVTIYDDERVQWLELIPKETHSDFSRVRLGFNDNDIRIMELSTNIGQIIRIEFLSVARNLELDEQLFRFSAPDYVDIIGEAAE
ncbi:MAG: outer membrane lipoprotein chaperone LolA [Gammaproteobacteria bacterium]|nr:outer membrane lipoprotein chaperone LolA [Gammaproteobacteria bacterium]